MATEVAVEVPAQAGPLPRPVSNYTLFGGFVGRTWLWFLGGCLVVTLVPLLFGWRPYVVESSSMLPRIKVGDVILAAPEHNPQKLLGRVTVFHDPDPNRIGSIKSHRVVAINSDGTLTTKGDANQSVDSVHVKVSGVIGLGRLLVRYVGLPLIWVQKGEWLKFALLLASIWFAALLVMRDRDEVAPPESEGNGPDGGGRTSAIPSNRRSNTEGQNVGRNRATRMVASCQSPGSIRTSDSVPQSHLRPRSPLRLRQSLRLRSPRLRRPGAITHIFRASNARAASPIPANEARAPDVLVRAPDVPVRTLRQQARPPDRIRHRCVACVAVADCESRILSDHLQHRRQVGRADLQLHDRDGEPRPVLVLEARRHDGDDRRRHVGQR